jgi:prepilin-type N-terminal cleavage/methylation domain-containing protein
VPGLASQPRRRRAAFTLIEILAVVAIVALLATFVAPNFGALRERQLRDEGLRLAAQLELARQRSVVTGAPHRLWVDLEESAYRVEWLPGAASGQIELQSLEDLDLSGGTPLPLAAPDRGAFEFEPIPGLFGRFQWLEEPLYFAGLETTQGFIAGGDTFIEFGADGSASPTQIVIEDGSGRRIVLAVLPLDDAVRFVDEDA